jgi:hypothetical protein
MGALPVVVPVIYVVDGDSILFRSPLDGGLAAACDGAVIAFEVDDFATSGPTEDNWSVHMVGVGTRLDDHDQLRVLRLGALDVNGRQVDQVVRLPIGRVSGRQLDRALSASTV